MNDSQLVRQVLKGDQEACTRLVRQYQESVFRMAYLILGDADEAKDIAQETFIRALKALPTFDMSRPLRPWLVSIAANLARNRYHAQGRQIAAMQRLYLADPDQLAMPSPQNAESIWQEVQQLEAPDQEIIYLRYFLDLSIAETAAALHIAEGTVKSRLHRALQRLRDLIQLQEQAHE